MNGFPQPFLVQLEPYLNDKDASALARCRKAHCIICYQRAARLFKWNVEVLMGYVPLIFLFPGDQFLRMQCAKICAVAYKAPVYMGKNLYMAPQYMTFDQYRDCLFLKDAQFVPQLDYVCSFVVQAQSICLHDPKAKLGMAARLNMASVYFALPTCVFSYDEHCILYAEALKSCLRNDHDVTIFTDLLTKSEKGSYSKLKIMKAMSCCLSEKNQSFYFFEHPDVANHLNRLYAVDFCQWFIILLRERKSVDAVVALQRSANLTDRFCRQCLINRSGCNFFVFKAPSDCAVELFTHLTDEQKIHNSLAWRATSEWALKRVRQWMTYFRSVNNYEKFKRLEKLLYTRLE